jgi:GntR family transcriptional regulator
MSSANARTALLRSHLLALVDGELAPHDKLPTERGLAEEFSVSRLTVRRALDRLERDGRVYRIQGSGTFVKEPRVTKSVELTSFSEDMRARGMVPGSQVLTSERGPAGDANGWALGLSPQDPVWHLRRLRTADGLPMCLENLVIPAHLIPAGFEIDASKSLYAELGTRVTFRPDHAKQTIRATVLDEEAAELLGVAPFSAALEVERTVLDPRGVAIELTQSLYRADRYSYELQISRNREATT